MFNRCMVNDQRILAERSLERLLGAIEDVGGMTDLPCAWRVRCEVHQARYERAAGFFTVSREFSVQGRLRLRDALRKCRAAQG